MNHLWFQLSLEALDSNELHKIDNGSCYDDLLITIISYRLSKKFSVIYKQPKSNHWYETIFI